MRILTVLLFIFCSFCVFAQSKHEDGGFKEYYKNGNTKTEGVYKNNYKVGRWKEYYENGQLKKENVFKANGNWTGYKRLYSEKGLLSIETQPEGNGGLTEKHYFNNGNLKREFTKIAKSNEKGFLKTGIYKEFYENGILKIKGGFNENLLVGVWKHFYPTSEIEWEVDYSNNYKQGTYRQFYKNGKVKVEGFHNLGLKHGEEKQYDYTGNETKKLKYRNGELKNASKIPVSEIVEVPDGAIEKVPLYPGCEEELDNVSKKKCMSIAISKFVCSKFNTTFGRDTNLKGEQKIYVIFKVDEMGNIIDIMAKAKHRALEAEAIRVFALLPKMTPGFQYGEPVKVPYSLPIVFKI